MITEDVRFLLGGGKGLTILLQCQDTRMSSFPLYPLHCLPPIMRFGHFLIVLPCHSQTVTGNSTWALAPVGICQTDSFISHSVSLSKPGNIGQENSDLSMGNEFLHAKLDDRFNVVASYTRTSSVSGLIPCPTVQMLPERFPICFFVFP